MEVQTTFCHHLNECARDSSPVCSPQSPLDWLSLQREELKAQAA